MGGVEGDLSSTMSNFRGLVCGAGPSYGWPVAKFTVLPLWGTPRFPPGVTAENLSGGEATFPRTYGSVRKGRWAASGPLGRPSVLCTFSTPDVAHRQPRLAGSFLKERSAIVRATCREHQPFLPTPPSRPILEGWWGGGNGRGRGYFAPEPASRTRPRRICAHIPSRRPQPLGGCFGRSPWERSDQRVGANARRGGVLWPLGLGWSRLPGTVGGFFVSPPWCYLSHRSQSPPSRPQVRSQEEPRQGGVN